MKKVTIYTAPACPYCIRAKQFFDESNIEYVEKLTQDHEEEHEALMEKYKWRTVPMIFIGEEFIGGYDDMMKLVSEGALEEKLQS